MHLLGNRAVRFFRFLPGDLVEVRGAEEILSTLDGKGGFEGLPFMPEMLEYCGRQFEVLRRADKTCAPDQTIRRLRNTVLLKELRCDGAAHGGCEAGCVIFWKEQWLKPANPVHRSSARSSADRNGPSGETLARAAKALGIIERAVRKPAASSGTPARERFSCQTTEVASFTKSLPWWEPLQYLRDLASGNVTFRQFWRGILIAARNKLECARGRPDVRTVAGDNTHTPAQDLNLRPGDLVRIKSKEEIGHTLDPHGKNRGLRFSPGMVGYCDQQFRVLRRVNKIIDERTGELISLKTGSVILEGVVCPVEAKRFCPRMVYQYWRDVWLKRVEQPAPVTTVPASVPLCPLTEAPAAKLMPESLPAVLANKVTQPAISPVVRRIREVSL